MNNAATQLANPSRRSKERKREGIEFEKLVMPMRIAGWGGGLHGQREPCGGEMAYTAIRARDT